ncbi:hypothetical protein WN944_023138 [Citrus x changshan-huyou]|uniref:Uncharacterized protein n=1 Tax=Citrus x changshan-huyou TaxID=2935761 RepID=A0AAP0N2C0_9ROSI
MIWSSVLPPQSSAHQIPLLAHGAVSHNYHLANGLHRGGSHHLNQLSTLNQTLIKALSCLYDVCLLLTFHKKCRFGLWSQGISCGISIEFSFVLSTPFKYEVLISFSLHLSTLSLAELTQIYI